MKIFKRTILFILVVLISYIQTEDIKINNKKIIDTEGNRIQKDSTRNYLKYKNVSTTVWGSELTYIPSVSVYKHLAFQGADNTLVVMINIKGDRDSNPVRYPDSIVNQALNNAAVANVKTTMLKLHLGTDYCDNYGRSSYNPNSEIFFRNWKAICLHYAQMCIDNDIPILCIGCEQAQQTVDKNYSYWEDLVSAIRSKYPNLLLTYAASIYEYQLDAPLKFWKLLDFIGFNMYFHYTDKLASQKPTLDEIMQAYYVPIFKDKSAMDLINMHADAFNKKVIITETGLMPKDTGLSKVYDSAKASEQKNYDGTALAIKAVCDGLCQNKNVIGFSWWHASPPFDYFNDTEVTSAEKTMRDYLKGGLI